MTTEHKSQVLLALAKLIQVHSDDILKSNLNDMANAPQDDALKDRLKIDSAKIEGMVASLLEIANGDDIVGKEIYHFDKPNGLKIINKLVPFGTILIIYESRPDVTIEAAAMAFKSGNRILLKGGKEASHSNLFLTDLWHQALQMCDQSTIWVTYLDVGRDEVTKMISQNTLNIDLVIPRGGDTLISYIRSIASMPVLVSGRGNNFLYIHEKANTIASINVVLDGKKRISVCNALDKVLIDNRLPNLVEFIQDLVSELNNNHIEVITNSTFIFDHGGSVDLVSGDEVLYEEFMSSKIMLCLVDDEMTAINTINQYSGGHSATIMTDDFLVAQSFQDLVDCAAVYQNASTRFTDGGQFGLGGEIAISTQKLHFRGPMSYQQLVTNKWYVTGDGQVRN